MKTKIVLYLILLLIFSAFSCSKQDEPVSEEIKASGKPLVIVTQAEKETIYKFLSFSGKSEAKNAINIAPELSMKIVSVYVEEGDKVKKNQILAKLDTTKMIQAELQYEDAKKNYERMKALKKSEYIEEQKFEQIKTVFETAKLNYEYIRDNTLIKAPYSGYITHINQKAGEFYSSMLPGESGSPSLFRLVNLDELRIIIQISDMRIDQINTGQKAFIQVGEDKEEKIYGRVTFVSAEADPYSGKFQCYINVENPGQMLKPNQYVLVKVVADESDDSIIIPQTALIDSQFVFVVEDDIAIKKEVKIGIKSEDMLQILSNNIAVGDMIVIKGNVGLRDNSRVKIDKN